MKIIDKYIAKGFFWPFLYCLFLFLFMYTIIDLFGHLDDIIKHGIPASDIKSYYLSSLPMVFVQTTPFAVLLATVFLLGNLTRHNEIVAFRSSGINTLRIIMPMLILCMAISLATFLVNDKVVPKAAITAKTIKELRFEKGLKKKNDILENVTVFGKDGKLFYARTYDLTNKTLNDVVILEHAENQILKRKITAERMEWLGNKWRFYNCDVFRFDKNGNVIGKPAIFRTPKILQFKETPEDLLRKQTQPEFMNYAQLREYIRLLALESKSTARKLFVELYYKLALPFANIVIMLIGIPFALKKHRGGAMASVGIALGIAICFYGANAIFLALGKGGFLPPVVSAWAANAIFISLGILLIRKVRI